MKSGPQRFTFHRPVDVVASALGLCATAPVLVISWAAAGRAAKGTGLFRQTRIGRRGAPFDIYKFRTMHARSSGSTVTTSNDSRITSVGRRLRSTKIDELPQLVNVLRGDMALVGPRPDVEGFADALEGADRIVLEVRPGITGPASLLFADEESLLSEVDDPDLFNRAVLYPLKTAINKAWVEHGSLWDDLRLLVWTLKPPADAALRTMIHGWSSDLQLDVFEAPNEVGK